ncbi:hypothetical protein [Mesomycoplasma dispar]|uniref:DUF2750 domain-containing protein n=1 Tax=Mesomycoplasma dispar TaxID=86660 RepID=A0ABN5DTS5_9BACT|nr:hypothetical protein [Mesomycoplasma dispar]ATP59550.1 hypothetical protein CSW10_01115 [Mesomycoplasma dispar]
METKNTKKSKKQVINLSDKDRVILANKNLDPKKPELEKFYSLFYTEFEDGRIFSVVFDESKNILAFQIDDKTWETIKTFSEFDDETLDILELQIDEFFDNNSFIFEGKEIEPNLFFNNLADDSGYDDIIEKFRNKQAIELPSKKSKN